MKKMKHTARLGAALLAGCMVLLVSGCGSKKSSDVEIIQNSGVLRVAIVDTQSSYTTVEAGMPEGTKPAGLEPELAEYIASALSVTPQFRVYEKQEALEALNAGEADIALGCINGSASLDAEYLTSISYGTGYFYVVTRDDEFALTVGSLENSVVGVDSGLDAETRTGLYKASGISVLDIPSAEKAAEQLENGTIRAYICYEGQAKQLLENDGLQVQNLSNLEPENFVIAARKTDQTLVSGINVLIPQFLEAEE